jgi:hypothetical protein
MAVLPVASTRSRWKTERVTDHVRGIDYDVLVANRELLLPVSALVYFLRRDAAAMGARNAR